MLALTPPSASYAQIAYTLLAIAVARLALPIVQSVRRKMRISKALEHIPGPKGKFFIGILPEVSANLHRFHEFQEDLTLQYGGRVNLPWNLFSTNSVFLSDPEDIKHILMTKFNNYVKTDNFIQAFAELFGKSFFALNHAHTADNGELWKLQRKVASRVFTTNNMRIFSESIFHKYAANLAETIKNQGGKCNMSDVSSQYSLQAIFDVLCGIPLAEVDDKLGLSFVESMRYVADNISNRILEPYYKYFWWCMPSEYRVKREAKVMTNIADAILKKRLQESDEEIAQRPDIMSRFIRKARELEKEEGGVSMLELDTLRSIFLTFNSAGWDTTSSAITYTMYALAQYPEVQRKLFEELQSTGKTDLTYDDIKNFTYLDVVLSEAMRVYPTVPLNQKEAAEDDYLPDGTFIPAGTTIFFSPWTMGHYNPVWGSDPEVFRPERWLEMKTRPSAYDFPVFQGGPRICIGMNMSLVESKIFIATMVSRFHIKIQDGEQLKNRGYALSPALTMKGGLPLQMTPREARTF